MKRSPMVGMIVALVSGMLIGGTLVSVALAATTSPESAMPVGVNVTEADVSPVHEAAAAAAAAALGISTADLSQQLTDGASLKQVADAQGVGYGTVARATTDAASAILNAAVSDGSLSQQRADETLSDVNSWVDHGGQPDSGWFGEPA